ncbi:sulfurtransferase TusA family protein [Xanthobacter dioxanivorans]|uniref:Sulfurtransferase TusA family protein n=1 Tax=Xanthobacter dioxanivorans TaxID=2528964 RepID=A0A974PM36_9HYPH|nr:sulfurtransferase TusA family protein [Xanthobacter dioxanivorans]QRG05495.1 sulfurtransferase TusA family protein [Xanthobacter dioxanivorans]
MKAAAPATVELDLRGLKCPLPALRTRKALATVATGTRLIVTCTDPMAAIDIPHVAQETGAALEERTVEQGRLTFVLRKGK